MTSFARLGPWAPPRRLLEDLLGLTLIVWAAGTLLTFAITAGVADFGTVDDSLMSGLASGLARFYAAFIGFYAGRQRMAQYLTHGWTRREFAQRAATVLVIFAAAFALMMGVSFALEYGLYQLADWPQGIGDEHLYDSGGQIHLFVLESLLVFLVWTAVGALIGAGFYRSDEVGLITLPLALIPIAATGIALGDSWGPFGFVLDRIADPGAFPVLAVVAVAVVSLLATLAMTWPIVRDMPIRSQTV